MHFLKQSSVLLILLVSHVASSQHLNFGLMKPQAADELPVSKAKTIFPKLKTQTQQATILSPWKDGELIFSQGWKLSDANSIITEGKNIFDSQYKTDRWFNAVVPGTVLTTLVESGVYPDPYYGLNNLSIPDSLSRTEWWYRIPFQLPKNDSKYSWLIFNGINYKADVWLNGKLLGHIAGAFKKGEFDITSYLSKGNENILAVHIYPPNNPGIPHEESSRTGQGPNGGAMCLDGPTFISSEGWDWIPGIRDRNIGLWQDVRLRFSNDASITETQVVTDLPLPDVSTADVTIKAKLKNSSDQEQTFTLEGKIDAIAFTQPVKLGAKEEKTVVFSPTNFANLKLRNPKLWWPNGYGAPNLYKLQLTVKDQSGKISDQKSMTFGVRELSYEMSIDTETEKSKRIEYNPTSALQNGKHLFDNVQRRDVGHGVSIPQLRKGADINLLQSIEDEGTGPYLVIKVNGKKIFCKGGNWGMDDGMKRVSRERLEPYIKLHQQENFNMIRNWTAESTEEEFYQLCDEYGLLVWNDFWISTEGFNVEPLDQMLSIDNALEVIRRFRNHPGIAVWCPRNEGYAPAGLEDAFAEAVAQEDGTRLYQGNSRYMNLRPSGPWHYFRQQKDYFTNNAKGFTTEIGTFSVPTAATMKKFLAPEDQWPINDVWYYHDMHREHAQKDYLKAIDSLYGAAKNLDDFCKKAQLVNYNSHRNIFEAWNSKLWHDGAGVLLWMSHPAWPSMIWQTYSWDYETHGAFFGSKKACEPVHIQMNLHDNKVVVVNTSLNDLQNVKCLYTVYDLTGKKISEKENVLKTAPANKLTDVMTAELPNGFKDVYLVRLTLTGKKGEVLSTNDYLKNGGADFTSLNGLPVSKLSVQPIQKKSDSQRKYFKLTNQGSSTVVSIKLSLLNGETGTQILPAYFSDGYFNLLPGESKEISVEAATQGGKLKVLVEDYNSSATFNL